MRLQTTTNGGKQIYSIADDHAQTVQVCIDRLHELGANEKPVSSNISLAFSKRVLASLANALLMVRFSCVGSTALGFA
jgi:hypothetical protein